VILQAWIDSLLLLIIVAAAILHLNGARRIAWCEALGFSIVAGAGTGCMAEWWWPNIEEYWMESVFHLGCAIVAIAVMRGDLRRMLNLNAPPMRTFHREILELARMAKPEDLGVLRAAAAAALRQEGIERRAIEESRREYAFEERRATRG
jgi:hypothetical protein